MYAALPTRPAENPHYYSRIERARSVKKECSSQPGADEGGVTEINCPQMQWLIQREDSASNREAQAAEKAASPRQLTSRTTIRALRRADAIGWASMIRRERRRQQTQAPKVASQLEAAGAPGAAPGSADVLRR